MCETTQYQGPTNPLNVTLFASRRPDWELPAVEAVHSDLQLTTYEGMQNLAGTRLPCHKCGKNRALYCYDCLLALVAVPQVQLPFKVSIITHHAENASKNTGVHARVLAPDDVDLHDIHNCPDWDPRRTVVLFPSDSALTVDQLEPGSVDRAIIIDSKWRKAQELICDPALYNLRCVRLAGGSGPNGAPRSAFWRFHTAGVADEGVCTVECLLHFLRAMVTHNRLAPHQLASARPSHVLLPAPVQPHASTQPDTTDPCQTQFSQPSAAAANQNSEAKTAAAGESSTAKPAQLQAAEGAPEPSQRGADRLAIESCQGGSDKPTSEPCQGDAWPCSCDPAHPPGYHAYDNLLWFFVLQHKHIQAISARRLEERKERRQKGEPRQQNKKKAKATAQQSEDADQHDE